MGIFFSRGRKNKRKYRISSSDDLSFLTGFNAFFFKFRTESVQYEGV